MIRKIIAVIIALNMLLIFSSCSKEEIRIDNSNKQMETQKDQDFKKLYDSSYFADLNSYESLEEIAIIDDGSDESKYVFSEATRLAKDFALTSSQIVKDYKIFGAYSIDIGAAGLNDGVKIYRLEYGLLPYDNSSVMDAGDVYVFDGTYFRFANANYLVAKYDDEGYETIRFINDQDLRTEYSSPELLKMYANPYRAAAMKLYDWYKEVTSLEFEEPDYKEIYGAEDVIYDVREALLNYYADAAEISEITYDSCALYDEASYVAYKVSIKKEESNAFEDLYYVASFDREGVNEISLSEIPANEFSGCDFEVISRIMNLMHPEASIRIDPYGFPYGPGSNALFFGFPVNEEPKIERQDWDPVWSEGSYWYTVDYEGFNAICYFDSQTNQSIVNSITTSRRDVQTYRGIRVGDSIEKLKESYPELKLLDKTIHPGEYDGDVFFYNPFDPENGEYEMHLNIIFYCDNGYVSEIKVINVFD